MSSCMVQHLPVPRRATARALLQQSHPQTAWAEWLLHLHPLCFSETQPSSSPSALLRPGTTLGAQSHSARSQKGGRETPTPNWPKCSGMAGQTYLEALWQMLCPCGMAGLRGTRCRCKAPSALGGCFLAAESHGAAQPSCIPSGSQEGVRGSSSAARISAALSRHPACPWSLLLCPVESSRSL